jgi:signal peptidase II
MNCNSTEKPPARWQPGNLINTLPNFRAHLIFWSVTLAGLMSDLWSKKVMFKYLQAKDGPVSIIGGLLQLRIQENPGAAFGIATGRPVFLVSISIIATVVLLAIFLFGKVQRKLHYAALGLFSAGVLGNLYDRLFNQGCVRDFIDVYYQRWHWPTFNLADTMLCIAVGILVISSFFKPTDKDYQRRALQQK